MPEISERGERVPFSPFRRLSPYAENAKAKGVHVYHLNIGQPDIETPPEALKKLREFERKGPSVLSIRWKSSIPEKLVAYYHKFGIDVNPDEIVVTNGGSEALGFVSRFA